MTSAVVRLYETDKQARKAVAKLREEGFAEGLIHLVTPNREGAESAEVLASFLKVGKLLPGDSKRYAEGLQQGRSLVIVEPPFGHAQSAIVILDGLNPILPVVEPKTASTPGAASPAAWDDAAPLSSVLGWAVVSRDNRPTPFSDFMGLKPLSQGLSWESPYCQLLKPHDSGLSSFLGLKLLKDGPTLLSSFLGLKTLADEPHPGEASFCRPLLSSNPTPLSSKLGYQVLSPNPAPLSDALGLKVLSKTV